MSPLAVVTFDRDAAKRRVIPMRWGFPKRGNWRVPDPIHAQSETIDSKPTFAKAFANGAPPEKAKSPHKTVEGINWKMTKRRTGRVKDEALKTDYVRSDGPLLA